MLGNLGTSFSPAPCLSDWSGSLLSFKNGRGIKCYPCQSVRTYIRFSTMMSKSSSSSIMVHIAPGFRELWPFIMKIHSFKRRPLSNSNIFYQNFMKLDGIVKYHDVFFKFDTGPYCTRLSRVMALCLCKFTVLNNGRSLTQIFFIIILWSLVTLFNTIMPSSSSIKVHIAPCFL